MRVSIQDAGALRGVSPSALSAYARAAGWKKQEPYGDHSDVYVRRRAPEIVIPRTAHLGDYADVVSRLIEIFAEAAETDTLSLYRDLVTADRDVVRVRAAPEGADGSVTLNDGVSLITGARDMVLAAARSLWEPRPLYRARPNREARDYMRQVRLGQTEQGSYVVTLLAPVVPPPTQQAAPFDSAADDPPVERRVTKRLIEALTAAREATERTSAGDADAFPNAVERGASANLCDAAATLIEPFGGIDVGVTWARTYPAETARETVRFGASDAPILREAAQRFRERELRPEVSLIGRREAVRHFQEREPRSNVSLIGRIQRPKRDDRETDETVTLRTYVEGRVVSVTAVLDQPNYDRAIQAHGSGAVVVMTGDLERFGSRWRLRDPYVTDVISDEDDEDDDLQDRGP